MQYMDESVFTGFPKIPRWNRDIIITEKIDGTNAQILIPENGPIVCKSGREVPFLCGSRNRWVFPENDNHGFAKWAYSHVKELLELGPGRHFGEWWGQGIQRGYGVKEKRFSLFNTTKWTAERPSCCHVVPMLYSGPMNFLAIEKTLGDLKELGSFAAPTFMKPEGVVIYHVPSGHTYKITLENDEKPKGVQDEAGTTRTTL